MNQSKIKTILLEVYDEAKALRLKEFIEICFKQNRQLLLLLFHTKLKQAILYTPKDWIQQPYVNTDELTEFLDAIFDMETVKEIELTEVSHEESDDIIILSNLLEIEAIEDQRMLFSKEYYTDNPMKIRDKEGQVAYIGTVLNDTICKQVETIFYKKIQPLEKPSILVGTPPKLEESTIKALIEATEKEDETSQKAIEDEEKLATIPEPTTEHSPKKKQQLLVALVTIALLLALGLTAFSYHHMTVHHQKNPEFTSDANEFTQADTLEIEFTTTFVETYTTKQTHYGIDISHYNGDIVSLLSAKDSLKFVICKATQGDYYVDPYFETNWNALKQKGIIRGAYHFYDTEVEPKKQAQHFLKVIKNLEDTDIAPVLDIEELSLHKDEIIPTVLQRDLLLFLQYVAAKTQRSPIIYVNTYFANHYLNNPNFANYRLYLASWEATDFPQLPETWQDKGLFLWQKSDTYHYENTTDDLDVFFGNLEDLYK